MARRAGLPPHRTQPNAVDSEPGHPYTRRSHARFRIRLPPGAPLLALAALIVSACASTSSSPVRSADTPPADPAVADAAVAATALQRPLHVVFGWTLQEREARFSGRGVTRYAPPARARLDLFGPRDETYLSAALIDMALHMPPGVPGVALPPPPLLWSVLGVLRPPQDAQLTRTSRDGELTELEYERADERWTFRLESGMLRYVEAEGPAGRRTVELSGDGAHGLPQLAVYRDWPAFRELRLNLQEANEVDGFPQDIWNVGR